MADYIKRSDLIQKAEHEAESMSEPYKSTFPSLVDWLSAKIVPIDDVAPVRRAIWKTESLWQPESLHFNYCSLCNKPSLMMTDFCPNCGAIMNKEETDG